MRRLVTLGALGAAMLTACGGSVFRRSGGGPTDMLVSISADSALRLAAQQLTAEGFRVSYASGQMLVTAPRAVPQRDQPLSTATPGDSTTWILVVTSEDGRFFRGSRINVNGFVVPKAAATPLASGAPVTQQQTIPITPDNRRLYAEVERVADSIRRGLPR